MNRSANATIKGYLYQFDYSIVQLLSLTDMSNQIKIEGREDIDITNEYEETLIQCKYYEGTEYNHSVIKDAVTQMLKHFKENQVGNDHRIRYKLYGHYKSGHKKLPPIIDVAFAKTNFFTYKEKKGDAFEIHEIWNELGISDEELSDFISILEIDINAMDFHEQFEYVKKLLKQSISDCDTDDLEYFYYPLAINVIWNLAIKANESDRIITGKFFLESINKKEIIFNNWLIKFHGDESYKKYLKKKYFTSIGTKIDKRARFFVIDASDQFNVAVINNILKIISDKYSHKEHKTTPSTDRFCPYVLILGIDETETIDLKKNLKLSGMHFIDGYAFKGADFDIERINSFPTKENQIRLKFLCSMDEFNHTLASVKGLYIDVFEFYKDSPDISLSALESVTYNKIKINDISAIKEIIR